MDLKHKAVAGIKWTAVSTVVITLCQFLTLTVLARLLSPTDFGLMGMVMVIIGFANLFTDMGISKAIIYRQNSTISELSSLYWLNIITGITVFIFVNAIIPLIVSFYHEEELTRLIHFASISFLIIPFGQQFQILMQRELKFNTLSKIDIGGTLINSIIAITFALNNKGVFSLIYGQLGGTIFRSVVLVIWGLKNNKPKLHFKKYDLKGYLGFGLYQMGEKSINYFNSNLDYLLIGTLLGAESLGYYNLASNLVLKPLSIVNPILTKVAFPVFSKIQNNIEKLKNGYLKVIQILSEINFPIMVGIAITAPILIPIFFGNNWETSIILTQILAIVGLLRSTANPVGALLLSKGRADLGFKWNLGILISQFIGLYIGAKIGNMLGIAIAVCILQILYTYFAYRILIRTILGDCLKEYFTSMWPSFWISFIMGAGVLIISLVFKMINNYTLFVIEVFAGVFIYLIFNYLFQKEYFFEMKELIWAKK